MYIENLNKISKKTYLDNFISKNKNKIEEFNSHIYADYFYFDNARNYGVDYIISYCLIFITMPVILEKNRKSTKSTNIKKR